VPSRRFTDGLATSAGFFVGGEGFAAAVFARGVAFALSFAFGVAFVFGFAFAVAFGLAFGFAATRDAFFFATTRLGAFLAARLFGAFFATGRLAFAFGRAFFTLRFETVGFFFATFFFVFLAAMAGEFTPI
jgi:hypothetical protein